MRHVLCAAVVTLALAACHTHSPVTPTPIPDPVFPVDPVKIVTFTASPEQVEPSEKAALWITTNHATRCWIEGVGDVTCAGSVAVPVDTDARTHGWTLHATDGKTTVSATASVSVHLIDVEYRVLGSPGTATLQYATTWGRQSVAITGAPVIAQLETVPKGTPLWLQVKTAAALPDTNCFTVQIWCDRAIRQSQTVCGAGEPATAEVSATY